MKEKIKSLLADFVYWLYEQKALRNKIHVMSIDETLDEILTSEKSIVRFGDGEIIMIDGKSLVLQKNSDELAQRLERLLQYKDRNLMIAIPDIFDGMDQYRESAKHFWKDHLLFFRRIYKRYCRTDIIYGNAFLSRCYFNFVKKDLCSKWFEKIKCIWKDRNIVIVEGSRSRNGVGNDLFAQAASVERIICPAENAFFKLREIEEICCSCPKDRLMLLSLGAAAKPLAEDLFLKGYRVIDIGNLDMEYEWFLRKASQKEKLSKYEDGEEWKKGQAGYEEYQQQVKISMEPDKQ